MVNNGDGKMNNDMKCPFCQQKLKTFAKYKDGTSTIYCSKCNLFGDSKLFSELIRTHKALEIAIQYIKHTQRVEPFWFNRLANKTLDEIKTALEQKDVK